MMSNANMFFVSSPCALFSGCVCSLTRHADASLAALPIKFAMSPWSTPCMIIGPYLYNCHSRKGTRAYWRCHNYSKRLTEERCRARCVIFDGRVQSMTGGAHNHGPHTDKINKILARRAGGDNAKALQQAAGGASAAAAPSRMPVREPRHEGRASAEQSGEYSHYDRLDVILM